MNQLAETTTIAESMPEKLLMMAVHQGADLEKLERLMALQEKWEANEARKAYHLAMSEFKAMQLSITKDKKVSYGTTHYSHASLANIVEVISMGLSKCGLSHSWSTSQGEGGLITVTCSITHRLGHSESVSLYASPDNSGGKNNIQGIGSTVTYLERYTLLALTGLAAADQDDDAVKAGTQFITEEQVKQLVALMKEVDADEDKFLKYLKVSKLSELETIHFTRATQALNAKKGKK